jgi:hypothetical protein
MRFTTFVLAAALLAAPAAASAQDNTVFAQQRFQQGSTLYDQRNFEGALAEFRQSVSLYNSPNARLYIARCLRELGRFDEAVVEYERTVREATDRAATDPRYVAARDAGNSELLAVRPRVGRLTLTVPDLPGDAVVRVNGRDIPREGVGVAMAVLPGSIAIHVEAPDFFPEERTTEVTAGNEVTVGVTLRRRPVLQGHTEIVRPPAPTPPPLPPPAPRGGVPRGLAWVGVGVGAAGLAGFAIFGALASGRYDEVDRACASGAIGCNVDQIAGGRTLATVANVSLGLGIAGAAAAAVLFLVGRPSTEAPSSAPTVTAGISGNGVTLSGVF